MGSIETKHYEESREVPIRTHEIKVPVGIQRGTIQNDPVNHPKHYTNHPSGIECITVTEHMNFNLGNTMKYIWRAGEKNDIIEDLQKARWYLDREITRLQRERTAGVSAERGK